MLCEICKMQKIGPKTPPFGYFFCNVDHMQCVSCNNKNRGLCALCAGETEFVSMTIEPAKSNKSILQEQPTNKRSCNSLIPFSRKYLADIEKLPQISQETINLYRSNSSLLQLTNEVNHCSKQHSPVQLVLQFWSENDIVHVEQVRAPTRYKDVTRPRRLFKENNYSKQKTTKRHPAVCRLSYKKS